MIAPRRNRNRNGGWSLVELAVVLAVIAVLGLVLWRVLPLAPKVAADEIAARELASAEQALLGYALAHNRLPAPVGAGLLPVDTLGLPSRMKLRYQVQAALTTAPDDDFKPLLPPELVPTVPTPAPTQVNGLDLCMTLKSISEFPLPDMQGVPTAFALMHTGPAGHDQAKSMSFALPGSADLGTRKVVAVGPGELASRLACPDRVARTHGAVRSAYAAYDMARIAQEYQEFRVFAIQVAEMNEKNAHTGVVFAGFDIAWGVVVEAIAILQTAAGWPPEGISIATGIASHALATAQLAVAIVNMVSAEAGLEEAKEAVTVAEAQRDAANVNLTRMQTLADSTRRHAVRLDQNGLQP
ncbi:type II secretory pathway pseudopilin PulG [Luteimonas cucumeris]|uniref:Type II secretory pathway pseudopilin PulG n=1 Tax=Luteimonas cucumeris TaxID=985012 RepID=A0A562LF27_9GAMM|nr:type II secretion system protein [Luteimonas cucumeris]TWI06219.1 type II secretory pathway pseudopilin PulG [Luteimonas cucumeris]